MRPSQCEADYQFRAKISYRSDICAGVVRPTQWPRPLARSVRNCVGPLKVSLKRKVPGVAVVLALLLFRPEKHQRKTTSCCESKIRSVASAHNEDLS